MSFLPAGAREHTWPSALLSLLASATQSSRIRPVIARLWSPSTRISIANTLTLRHYAQTKGLNLSLSLLRRMGVAGVGKPTNYGTRLPNKNVLSQASASPMRLPSFFNRSVLFSNGKMPEQSSGVGLRPMPIAAMSRQSSRSKSQSVSVGLIRKACCSSAQPDPSDACAYSSELPL